MTQRGGPPQDPPPVDNRDPADVVTESIDKALALIDTWINWDGTPVETDGRIYAPIKSLRRVSDHLIDHLAEIDARLAGVAPLPDLWHGSFMTSPSDVAPVTPEDLNDARNRLERLRQIWQLRLRSLSEKQLDRRVGDEWTLREVAFHVAESSYYAEAVGDLSPSH